MFREQCSITQHDDNGDDGGGDNDDDGDNDGDGDDDGDGDIVACYVQTVARGSHLT